MTQAGDIILRLAGPDVSPTSVEAHDALELAASYLELLQKTALEEGGALEVRGIEVVAGSAVLKFKTPDLDLASNAGRQAQRFITGQDCPPPGLQSVATRVKTALRPFKRDFTAEVIIGPWKERLSVELLPEEGPATSTLSLRATPKRVGGANPSVRFESDSEARDFTLRVNEDVARQIGPHLYRELDIVALVRREADGTIRDGMLEEFFPVSEEEPVAAWRRWLEASGCEFATVEEAQTALRSSSSDEVDEP